jgi:hypothetical protein
MYFMSNFSAETLTGRIISKHKVHSISKRIGVFDWLVTIVFNVSVIKSMKKMIKTFMFSTVSVDHF